jgi:hypothetical protein
MAMSAESAWMAARSAVVQLPVAVVELALGVGLLLDDELLLPQPATMTMARAASARSATAAKPLLRVHFIRTPFSGGAPPDASR